MKTGDSVLISPEVTHKSEWTQGTVIEVEANPFVGTVISAETPSGEIYFDKEYQFKPAIFPPNSPSLCRKCVRR